MEKLTIKTPADVLSFIGHTLGFWPQESLVCITLDDNRIGATLRIDLPRQPGQELPYARTVADYLDHDTNATILLFAVYTSEPETRAAQTPRRHHRSTDRCAGRTRHHHPRRTPRRRRQPSPRTTATPAPASPCPSAPPSPAQINAEFVYRGSTIEPTDRITLPTPTKKEPRRTAVEHHMKTIVPTEPDDALEQGQDTLGRHARRQDFPERRRRHRPGCQLAIPHHPRPAHRRHPRSRRTHAAGPVRPNRQQPPMVTHRMGPATAPPRLHAHQHQNTPHPSSPPSATSTGGKAEAAKPTNSSNSPSTPTPPTASPASATK